MTDTLSFPTKEIKKPIVLLIGCIDYDPNVKSSLPGSEAELNRLQTLFETTYGATVLTTYAKGEPASRRLTRKRLMEFCQVAQAYLKGNPEQFDGLIICYSGHGYEDALLLSDGKIFSVSKLEAYFKIQQLPAFADLPVIFIYSKCRGGDVADPVKVGDTYYHPEQNVVRLYGNAKGEQIADNPPKGAYMIDALSDILENVGPALSLPLDSWFRVTSAHVQEASGHKEAPLVESHLSYHVVLKPKKRN